VGFCLCRVRTPAQWTALFAGICVERDPLQYPGKTPARPKQDPGKTPSNAQARSRGQLQCQARPKKYAKIRAVEVSGNRSSSYA